MNAARTISIVDAYAGNLRNITLEIPKNKLTVFTGLSGSGKSTLLIDVLTHECQRLHLEALSMQGIPKPKVERVQGASPAIAILQNNANRNPRSTVGTLTDLYTALRMIYEKLCMRTCPHCSATICAADCREETQRTGDDFHVFMYCSACNHKMDKLTRTDFSFNTQEGACPTCSGMGSTLTVNKAVVVNESQSLEEGAVAFWSHKYQEYQIGVFSAACQHFGIPLSTNKPVQEFSALQKALLYDGINSAELAQAFPRTKPPKTVAGGRFEGILPALMRRLDEQGLNSKARAYFTATSCPSCQGERLRTPNSQVTVESTRLPELTTKSLRELHAWIRQLDTNLPEHQRNLVEDYLLDINTKLSRIAGVGLDYLTLDRTSITLSGGELQRLRLSAILDSELSGIIYILDEPTAGLHPKDTDGLITILRRLRNLGNTVLVIEHDPDIMRAADHLVDMGPGAGSQGGSIVAQGTLSDLAATPDSATGQFLQRPSRVKQTSRKPSVTPIKIKNACAFNLNHLQAHIPTGCLTTVTGPSGSGKSTLVLNVLAHGDCDTAENSVSGCHQFNRIVEVGQSSLARMKRSNIATYTELYAEIRKAFASTESARTHNLSAKAFSFNTPGGRCETCEGMGSVTNNLLFFTDTETTCPTCHGKRFNDDVVSVQLHGLTISEVLALSVGEAALTFATYPKIVHTLRLLNAVGLEYLALGQTLTTLSGGEAQRLKLAKELLGTPSNKTLYLLDEPTSGLHPLDVENFLTLLNRLVDEGNTVVVIEHNQQVILASDWVIDLGPEGGNLGGTVIFEGTPASLIDTGTGPTADYLRRSTTRPTA